MLSRGLGTEWMILDNGFKYFPSILASHSPIGATLDIVARQAPAPQDIAAVTVRTYATVKSHFSSKQVDATMAARLSVPYCVAVALVDGQVTQRQFDADRYRDPVVRGVMDKVEIVADDELTKLYPEKFPAQVSVAMTDGTVFEAEMYYPRGDPGNPLSDDELCDKFRDNVAGVLGDGDARTLLAVIRDLAGNRDMAALGALLRADGRTGG
jgi:2-methylcitrate dehydratase PrpD